MPPTPSAVVLVIIDGLADAGESPLEAARTPTLDLAAARGRQGLIDPVAPGLACGSDTAHLAIFGYDPRTCYRGRGALEALGAGMRLRPNAVAFKTNFATMREPRDGPGPPIVVSRCASSLPNMHHLASKLCTLLNGMSVPGFPDVHVAINHASAHRCNVAISGPRLSDHISNTDPLVDNHPLLRAHAVDDNDQDAVRTAAVVNAISEEVTRILCACPWNVLDGVDSKPATNVMLLRGAAQHINLQPFHERHNIRAFFIAPTHIVAGVGITVGIPRVDVPGATGNYDTDLFKKADTCASLLMERHGATEDYSYSMGIIHVKAVDEASHEQNVELRTYWTHKCDQMLERLLRRFHEMGRKDVVIIVTGDHSSAAVYGDHTCEPVPIVFSDVFDPDNPHARAPYFIGADASTRFTEVDAGSNGSLGRFPAQEIMRLVKGVLSITEPAV